MVQLSDFLNKRSSAFVLALLLGSHAAVGQDELANQGLALSADQPEPRGCPTNSAVHVDMPLLTDEDRELVRAALNLDGMQRFPICAYHANSDSNRKKKWVEQYIPTDEPESTELDEDQIGWRLVSLEGREPDEKDLEKYRHSGGALYPYQGLREMVDFTRLTLAERTSNRVVFETRPTIEFLEDNKAPFLLDHVTMTLVIDSDTRRLEFVTTKLNEEFKPNAFMRVYDFDQFLDYEYVPEVGEVVLTELQMRADVKFVVIRRDFYLTADLYDFSCPSVLQPTVCEEPETATLN